MVYGCHTGLDLRTVGRHVHYCCLVDARRPAPETVNVSKPTYAAPDFANARAAV